MPPNLMTSTSSCQTFGVTSNETAMRRAAQQEFQLDPNLQPPKPRRHLNCQAQPGRSQIHTQTKKGMSKIGERVSSNYSGEGTEHLSNPKEELEKKFQHLFSMNVGEMRSKGHSSAGDKQNREKTDRSPLGMLTCFFFSLRVWFYRGGLSVET